MFKVLNINILIYTLTIIICLMMFHKQNKCLYVHFLGEKSLLTLEKKVSSDWCLLVMACVLVSYQKSIKKITGRMNEGVTHEYV